MNQDETTMRNDQVGLGVDVVEIDRMRRILGRTPSFRTRVFSEDERRYCDSTAHPAAHYAMRFAAREAVAKALGTGFSQGVSWNNIVVSRTNKGRVYAELFGEAKAQADRLGVREIPLSLSYTRTVAVACAMAITEASQQASEKRKNPMEELAKQFKDLRGMLDTIESPREVDAETDADAEADIEADADTEVGTEIAAEAVAETAAEASVEADTEKAALQ